LLSKPESDMIFIITGWDLYHFSHNEQLTDSG
jgi:hypothetical protein